MPVADSLARLLDDAGSAPGDSHDGLVGSRVVPDTDLPDLPDPGDPDETSGQGGRPGLPVTLVATGGAGQVAGPLALAARRGVPLAGLHLTARDPGDPLGAVRRLLAALDDARDDLDRLGEPPVRVGLPADRPGHGWLVAADEVAAAGHGLLLATSGGPTAVPAGTVVAWLDAALAREVPFSLATGDHPAVRLGSGHGLLNLLLATRGTLDGAAEDDLTWLLEQTDGETLVDLLAETGDDAAARARRWLTSAATTDVGGVARDLRALGLVA